MAKLGSKHCGLDIFPPKLMHKAKSEIIELLVDIVNTSFKEGSFPDNWKTALIKPLIKKINAGTTESNYRPVSNLKYFSKVLECAALKQIVNHCESNNLLPDNQSAYRKGYSCETMLMKLVDIILNGMEDKLITAVMACDLSAAFDTVNHSVLLETFKDFYGMSGNVLQWIESYLSNRSCLVDVNGKRSSEKKLSLSVPQGSCSGAFFFILYAATIFFEIDLVELFGFADDHILPTSFPAGDRLAEMDAIIDLEDSAIDIKEWMDKVKLKINTDKTEFITFGFPTQREKCVIDSLNVVNDVVPKVDCIKYLGAHLDASLSFRTHISKKCNAAAINLGKIRSIRDYLTQDACVILLLGLVISHLDYGNALLINCTDTVLKPYKRIQNSAAKLALKWKKCNSATEALRTLHWLPIRARIEFKVLVMMHNCTYGKAPLYLRDLVAHRKVSRSLRNNTQADLDYNVPYNVCKTFGDRSFSYAGPVLWNSLPYSVKSKDNIEIFKKDIKTFLFKKYL